MEKPLISIILPTYNVAAHIERCLNSCLNQEFTNYEIIIVDDCCTDNSIEIASSFAFKDSRIKIVKHEKNLGTYHARKTGTYSAKGNFILYLDPDDELTNKSLTTFSELIKKYPYLDLLLFNFEIIPSVRFWNVKPTVPCGVFKEKISHEILKENRLTYGTPGKLYSKKSAIKGFDCLSVGENIRLVYGEDALIFSAILLNANFAVGVSDVLYLYYQNETSITMTKGDSAIFDRIQQLELVIFHLNELKNKCQMPSSVEVFINRMEVDKLKLFKKVVKTNFDYLNVMFKIVLKGKSFIDIVRVFIFLLTLTNKKM
ncbi:glycosyltransferase [Marinomonas shanghaiensis]|uniref:glycosyltransferase n=1 Tax=Marinomonas shanghaiensis TaxID=2202418 RepID=UPI000DBA67D3|nr:glycosyltransferase [Marinomonas shanghaiensis]